MNEHESLIGVIRTLVAWRKRLIIAVVGVGLATALVSLFIPDYYQSSTTFFAASSDMTKPDRIFGPPGSNVEYFGSGSDIDRVLTIASSTELIDLMIDTFQLFDIYHIDRTQARAREKVRERLRGHMTVTQTKYDGITVGVEDRDPARAARMANGARDLIDAISRSYLRSSQEHLLATYDTSIQTKQVYLVQLADSLERVQRTYGVYDHTLQYQVIGDLISRTSVQLAGDRARLRTYRQIGYSNRDTIANLTARVASLEAKLSDLSGTGAPDALDIRGFAHGATLFSKLKQQFENTKNQLSYDIEKANHLRAILSGNTTTIIPVEPALVPEVKSRPKRAFIVLAAMALTLVFGILYILLREHYRSAGWDRPMPA